MFDTDTTADISMETAFSTAGIVGANVGVLEEETPTASAGVVFEKGMKLTDFLRANPGIRTKDEVLQYYDEDVIQRAIRIGAVAYMRGRLVL